LSVGVSSGVSGVAIGSGVGTCLVEGDNVGDTRVVGDRVASCSKGVIS